MFSTYPTMFRVYLKAIDAIATGKVCSCKKYLQTKVIPWDKTIIRTNKTAKGFAILCDERKRFRLIV